MKVYAAVNCGLGKEQCEDSVLVGDSIFCNNEAVMKVLKTGAVCVADGVGGNAGGHFASAFITEHIRDAVSQNAACDLRQLLKGINTALLTATHDTNIPNAATTLTGIVFETGKQFLIHIGNTRAYILQGRYLKQLTTDHTVYHRLVKMGRINEADQSGKNEITNCLGGGNPALLDSLTVMELPHFNTLLLTSDGVHDYIEIDELESLLTSEAVNETTCGKILKTALVAGSTDDTSVVIIQK